MKKILFFLVLSIALMESCVPIAKLTFGIRNPKEETPESLKDFLLKNGYPEENVYQLRDSSAFLALANDTIFRKLMFETIFFTGDFRRIKPDTAHCQWSGGYLLKQLKKDSAYQLTDNLSFSKFNSMIMPMFDSLGRFEINKGEYDFIVLNTWAKFIGKMNKRIFCLNEVSQTRPDLKLLVINLNMDMQKSWKLNKDQQIQLE